MKPIIGYYQFSEDGFQVATVLKTFWDIELCLADSYNPSYTSLLDVMPLGFFELSDSVFEYSFTALEAKRILDNAGFTELQLF